MKKCLFPIYAYVVSCAQQSNNLKRYLMYKYPHCYWLGLIKILRVGFLNLQIKLLTNKIKLPRGRTNSQSWTKKTGELDLRVETPNPT